MTLHYLNPQARRAHALQLAHQIAATAERPEIFRPRIARAREALAALKVDAERRVLAALDESSDS